MEPKLDEGLRRFLAMPLMVIVGTANTERRPSIGRAVGINHGAKEGHIEVMISEWQWPDTVTNIRASGRAAITCVSPATYESYQMKGPAWIRATTEADLERTATFIPWMREELVKLGVPYNMTLPWLTDKQIVVSALKVEEIYVQTPGPKAGMTARRRA